MSQVIFEVLDLANKLTDMKKYQKTISIPRWYRYGLLDILPLSLFLYKLYHINRLHHVPWLSLNFLIQIPFGFQEEN